MQLDGSELFALPRACALSRVTRSDGLGVRR
jgi:hypothetical protein